MTLSYKKIMGSCLILVEDDSLYNNMLEHMFNDIICHENMVVNVEKKQNLFFSFLKKNKVQKTAGKIVDFFLARHYGLYDLLDQMGRKYNEVNVLFLNSSFIVSRFPAKVLLDYRKKWNNISYYLFYIDIVSHPVSVHANMLREMGIFDKVYTIDRDDAKKYGIQLWPTPYSQIESYSNIQVKRDVYFCGVTKGRTKIICDLLKIFKARSINVKMDIVCGDDEMYFFSDFLDIVTLHKEGEYLQYKEVLKRSLEAQCILDIVQDGQTALTLRPYEAVVYDRLLLTNNSTITDYSYYQKDNMSLFISAEDIDIEWLQNKREIKHEYQNDFSPIHLWQDIISEKS